MTSGMKKAKMSRNVLYPRPLTDFQPGAQLQNEELINQIKFLSFHFISLISKIFESKSDTSFHSILEGRSPSQEEVVKT